MHDVFPSLIPSLNPSVLRSYHRPAGAFLTLTGEVIGVSQPAVAVVCRVEDVYVADEHLEAEITQSSQPFILLFLSFKCHNLLPDASFASKNNPVCL